jgi:hypothetical protein
MMKRMLPLKAIKPHLYGTRRLEAGDEYEAPVEEAIAQVAMRRADFIKGRQAKEKETWGRSLPDTKITKEFIESIRPDEIESSEQRLDRLRLEATQLGIDVDGRWGMARLQHEIDQAKAR